MKIKKICVAILLLACTLGLTACASNKVANQNKHVSEVPRISRTTKAKNKPYTNQQYHLLLTDMKKRQNIYQQLIHCYKTTYYKIQRNPRKYAPKIKHEFKISKKTNRKVASGSKPDTYFNGISRVSLLYINLGQTNKVIKRIAGTGKPKGQSHLQILSEINYYSDKSTDESKDLKQITNKFTKLCLHVNHKYN